MLIRMKIPRTHRNFPGGGCDGLVSGQAHAHCPQHGVLGRAELEHTKFTLVHTGCGAPAHFCVGPQTTVLIERCSACQQVLMYPVLDDPRASFKSLHRRECPKAITCPVCDMTSYHPRDIEYGFCGKCNAFTSKGKRDV